MPLYKEKYSRAISASALKMEGVSEFLEGLELYTRQIIYDDKFGAKVFKISRR